MLLLTLYPGQAKMKLYGPRLRFFLPDIVTAFVIGFIVGALAISYLLVR